MKNQKSRKGFIVSLVLSLVANVVLLSGVFYIGMKTEYFKRIEKRLGFYNKIDEETTDCEIKPEVRCDYWCIQGWTNTLVKLNYDADVVFFGNSITRGGNFQNFFPNEKTCNLGYPGDNLEGMMFRVEQIKAVNPEKVFVMAGINGLQGQAECVFESEYQCLVDSIKNSVPNAEVYLQSILPVNHSMANIYASEDKIKKANGIIKAIATRSGCVYVDLYSLYEKDGEMPQELTRDGVHLFPEAYERWMEEIREYIEE